MHVNPLTWCIYCIVAVKRRAGPRSSPGEQPFEIHLSATLPGRGPGGPGAPGEGTFMVGLLIFHWQYIKSTCDTNINTLTMLF